MDAVGWSISETMTWWITSSGIDAKSQTNVIEQIRFFLLPLAAAVLIGGVMAQGIRMSLTRRGDPLVRVGRGLLTFALVSSAGTTAVLMALEAGDAFSSWVLTTSSEGKFEERMKNVLTLDSLEVPVVIKIMFGILALLMSLIQNLLMMIREGSLVVLTATLTLAAAGKVTNVTEGWFPRVSGWSFAMITYKPVCSLVYSAAFLLVGEGGNTQAVFVGFAMMILAIVAIAPLTRLFSWATGEVGAGGGGMGSLMMNAGFALQALASMRGGRGGGGSQGGGWTPQQHANHLNENGPGNQTPTGGQHETSPRPTGPGGGGPPGGGPGGAGPGGGGPAGGGPGGGRPSGGAPGRHRPASENGGGAGRTRAGGGAGGVAAAAAGMAQQAGQSAADAMGPPQSPPPKNPYTPPTDPQGAGPGER